MRTEAGCCYSTSIGPRCARMQPAKDLSSAGFLFPERLSSSPEAGAFSVSQEGCRVVQAVWAVVVALALVAWLIRGLFRDALDRARPEDVPQLLGQLPPVIEAVGRRLLGHGSAQDKRGDSMVPAALSNDRDGGE